MFWRDISYWAIILPLSSRARTILLFLLKSMNYIVYPGGIAKLIRYFIYYLWFMSYISMFTDLSEFFTNPIAKTFSCALICACVINLAYRDVIGFKRASESCSLGLSMIWNDLIYVLKMIKNMPFWGESIISTVYLLKFC
mgnify:CR=1 FL=1